LESKLEIKMVRPPSANYTRPTSKQDKQGAAATPSTPTTPTPSTSAPVTTAPAVVEQKPPIMPSTLPPQTIHGAPTSETSVAVTPPKRRSSVATTESLETAAPVETPDTKAAEGEAADKAAKLKKINRVKARR